MLKKAYFHSMAAFVMVFASSCSVKRFLPAGEKLYAGEKLKIELATGNNEKPASFERKLSKLAKPKRNKLFLGAPYKVWWWYVIGQPKKDKGLKYWVRSKLGEAPVLFADVNTDAIALNMQAFLANQGYFNSTVKGDTVALGDRFGAVYEARIERPYLLGSVGWRLDSSLLARDLVRLTGETRLKTGERYSVDKINEESNRITSLLKDKGYYYFKSEDIVVFVDTNQQNHSASLYLGVQKTSPVQNKIPYRINKVTSVVDANFVSDTVMQTLREENGIYVLDLSKQFKPLVFPRAITFRTGNTYSLSEHTKSLTRLNSYGTFKFIRSEFKRSPDTSSNTLLDAYYFLNTNKKKRLQFELSGFFRSNNYSGAEVAMNWRHRNLFRGAEILNVKTTGSYEISVNDSLQQNNVWRLGLETSIEVPKFLAPVRTGHRFAYLPKTRFVASYDWVRRVNMYTQNYFHFRYELNWSDTSTVQHRLTPFGMTYYLTDELSKLLHQYSISDTTLGFIIPSNIINYASYQFSYSNSNANKRNVFYFHVGLETAGSILGLIKGNDGPFTTKVFDAFLAQYVRGDFDLRYIRKLGEDLFLANRLIVGTSYPYGNSVFLPFTRQYIIGGANSLRGFLPRKLGPGAAQATNEQQSAYPQIGGDYKLEMNTEFRFRMIGRFKGALFADAGNIWMKDTVLYSQKGKLTKDFYRQIAFDGGFGMRLDVTLLVIRLDLGIPFYKPWLDKGQRWVFRDFDIGDPDWRRENLVWNLAIGYPF